MKTITLVALLVVGVGRLDAQLHTVTPTDVAPLFASSQQFLALPEYDVWWDELIIACECTPATELINIIWRETQADSFPCPALTTRGCVGQWLSTGDIFLARGYRTYKRTVQHEMLHAILGTSAHPALFIKLGLGDS